MILKLSIWLGWCGIVVAAPACAVLAAQGQVAWLIYTALAMLVLVGVLRRACDRLERWNREIRSEFNPRHVDAEWRRAQSRL